MTCQDLLAALNDYLDGEVDSALCKEFQQHLAGCNPCQVVVDTTRKTITLFKQGKPCDLPKDFQQRLHEELQKRWRERTKSNPAQGDLG